MNKSILAACAVAATAVAFAFSPSAMAATELFKDSDFATYKPDLKAGEAVFNAGGCASCHSVEGDLDLLAGGRAFENRLGKVYAPNITADEKAGIGKWTNAQFLNALLHGAAPDGHAYFSAFFPYPAYARMKPEDALNLRAYMASLPQSDQPSKPNEVNIFGSTSLGFLSNTRPPLKSPAEAQMSRGEYLVEAVGACGECHTPRNGFSLDESAPFTGYLGYFGEFAPDISAARLAKVSPEAFIQGSLGEAKKLNGKPMAIGTMRRIAARTASLSIEDRTAIYAYLSGKPIDPKSLAIKATKPAPAAVIVAQADTKGAAVQSDADPWAGIADVTKSPGVVSKVRAACEASASPAKAAATPAAAPAGNDEADKLATAADRILDQSCRTCHGPGQRNETTFPIRDISEVAADPGAVNPGNPEKSAIYSSIASNRMPLGSKLTPEELDQLKQWIASLGSQPKPAAAAQPAKADAPVQGKVDQPRFIPVEMTQLLLAAVSDMRQQEEQDRPYIRYFTFTNAQLPKVDCNAVGKLKNPVYFLHAGFNKFINSVSRGKKVVPAQPVDGTEGALVRIDIRDYGWTADDWNALTTGLFTDGAREAGFTEKAWHDLAKVYPFAVDPKSDDLLGSLSSGSGAPVPMMDATWFTHFVSEGAYYDMLLRLPPKISDLEERIGVDVNRDIHEMDVLRAGFAEGTSGVSDHNRMIERHDISHNGYYWKSYDFAGSNNDQSLLLHPDGPISAEPVPSRTQPFRHDGGEMIFSLQNGMQGYYLSTAAGDRLQVGPTTIVSFRNKPIGRGVEIVNARSCFDCHENGIIKKSDALRSFIQSSNQFTREQREDLFKMYKTPEELQAAYDQDMQNFVSALKRLDVVSESASGQPVSVRVPQGTGGSEAVTFLADQEFANLDMDAVARSFFLTEAQFRERITSVGDPALEHDVREMLNRLDSGLFVTRSELEALWAPLLPHLTDYRALDDQAVSYSYPVAKDYEATATAAVTAAATAAAKPYEPPKAGEVAAYQPPPAKPADPLVLQLSVPQAKVKVNDLLTFSVKANRRCELQILYIEESHKITELPPEVLGAPYLEAGEERWIPAQGSGLRIRFDSPGKGESMVAYCRENGLGDKRLTAEQATAYAKERFQPLSRGIVIERTEQVSQDNGQSATNAVTFNVTR